MKIHRQIPLKVTGQGLNWARESVLLGARRVVVVEVMAESYDIADDNRRRWGLTDHVTLQHGSSTELEIDPKAEVCVSEIIGSVAGVEGAAADWATVYFPLFANEIPVERGDWLDLRFAVTLSGDGILTTREFLTPLLARLCRDCARTCP